VPAVEASMSQVVRLRDRVLVKGLVVGMLEPEVLQSFVVGYEAIADNLDFWLVRNGFQIRVENAALCVDGLAVTVAFGGWVKAEGEFILSFWGAAGLVLQDHNLFLVEGVSYEIEVII